MPPTTDPATHVTLAEPSRPQPATSTVSWSPRSPAATWGLTWLTTAPRQERSSTTRPAALAALRMAALARHRPIK
eukprot:877313-Alexandrium_andersonii.AAC.1